ncbi:MAG: prephenate dehydrogenase/arogenate dehydrogenase family protein [Desulfatibacillaceae bacterium]
MDDPNFTIGIVGGMGKMGQWFARFFENAGHRVIITGRKTEVSTMDLPEMCDAIFLSVPLAPAVELAGQLGPKMREGQLLSDFCSLKADITHAMGASAKADVVGTHPLFGPRTASLAGQNVVLCHSRGDTWLPRLERLFTEHGAVVTKSEPEEHDRMMSVVQGMNHFVTVALGRAVQRMGIPAEDLARFSTPLFRLRMNTVGRLFAQDLWLFEDLIEKNPGVPEILDHFEKAVAETKDAFSQKAAARLMEEVREHWRNMLEPSLAESEACLTFLTGAGSRGEDAY